MSEEIKLNDLYAAQEAITTANAEYASEKFDALWDKIKKQASFIENDIYHVEVINLDCLEKILREWIAAAS